MCIRDRRSRIQAELLGKLSREKRTRGQRIEDVELGCDHHGAGNNHCVERVNKWSRYESENHGQSFEQVFRNGADLHGAPYELATPPRICGDPRPAVSYTHLTLPT